MRRYLIKFFLIGLAIITVLYGCSEDSLVIPDEPEEGYTIVHIDMPDTVYIGVHYDFKVDVYVEGEISEHPLIVIGDFSSESGDHVLAGSLDIYDNSTFYDNVPGDFKFTRWFPTEYLRRLDGDYKIHFKVTLALLPFNISNTYTVDLVVSTDVKNFPPRLLEMSAPDSVDIGNQSQTNIIVKAIDFSGLNDIETFTGKLYYPFSTTAGHVFNFYDDGTNNDEIAGDSLFTGTIEHTLINDTGTFSILVDAIDRSGQKSNELFKDIYFYGNYNNLPPEILSVTFPDSIQASNTTFLIETEVSDPNGLTNIETVYFRTLKPDGTYSSSSFELYDDGNLISHSGLFSGDAVAGDGIYSFTFSVPAATPKGTYTFQFNAVDKGELISNRFDKSIVIY